MNKSYKVIYRESLGRYSVVSELVRACAGRTCSSRFISVGTLMAAFGAAILSASATAGATSYSGSVGTDGKVAIDLGVDIDGDHVPDTIEVSGVGLSVVEVVNSETGEKYYSLASPNATSTGIGRNTNVIGGYASGEGGFSNALGYYANAKGSIANAIGNYAQAIGLATNAIGGSAQATKDGANALGYAAVADGFFSNAVGYAAKSHGAYSSAFGNNAKASGGYSFALGHYATASAGSSVALGKDSVADEENTVSVGRTALSVSDNADANGTTITRRIVNVASGTKSTDAATVGQLQTVSKKEGEKYLVLTPTTDETTGITNNELSISASDTIASGTTALATVKAVYDEVRPTADGTYVKTGETTGKNLSALDTQVKSNADDIGGLKNLSNITSDGQAVIRSLAQGSVKVVDGTNTKVVEGASGDAKTYAVNVTTDGRVETDNAGIVTGGTVKKAIDDLKADTAADLTSYAKADASNVSASAGKWAAAIGTGTVASGSNLLITGDKVYAEVRPSADGAYVKTGETTGKNLSALDTQVKSNADDIGGLKNLSNITSDGQAVIRNLAQGSVKVVDGTNTKVVEGASGDAKTYAVNVTTDGRVETDNAGIVTGGTVKKAIDDLKTLTDGAIANLGNSYALLDGTNLSNAAFNAGNWASALGGGVIGGATVTNSNLLVTGSTVFAEVRPEHDGYYVKNEWTAGQNFIELDSQIKSLSNKIAENDGKISAVDQKAEDAKTAAAAAQGKADLAYGKAEEAKAEALKHSSVVSSNGHLTVTKGTNADGGAQYDLAISETADFTAKQTTWKSEDGKVSTANSSGFFSGGTSAADSNAYVSDGVVSAGKSESTKIVLDGNTGKASFGNTVTIDGATGRISGVTAGEVSESSTDAVNGAQLYEVQQGVAQNAQGLESLGRAVNKVDRKIDRTGALAAALAGLHPQDYDEDHPVSGAVGIGHYKGKQALAVGMFVRPVENFMVSLGASGSADDYMLNAGASFRFGGPTMKKSPQQMAARLSDQEVTIRDLSAQNQAQKTRLESQDEKLLKQASEIKDQKAEISAQKARLESQDAKLERQASEIEQLKAMMAKIQAKLGK